METSSKRGRPTAEETFEVSRLHPERRVKPPHRSLHDFYRELLSLRRRIPALQARGRERRYVLCRENDEVLIIERHQKTSASLLVLHFGHTPRRISFKAPMGLWRKVLDSKDIRWGGEGSSAPDRALSFGKLNLPLASRGAWAYARTFP